MAMLDVMESMGSKERALEELRARSKKFETVKALAEIAVEQAAEDRAKAAKVAMGLAPTKDVAEAAGVSVQRLYKIVKQ